MKEIPLPETACSQLVSGRQLAGFRRAVPFGTSEEVLQILSSSETRRITEWSVLEGTLQVISFQPPCPVSLDADSDACIFQCHHCHQGITETGVKT